MFQGEGYFNKLLSEWKLRYIGHLHFKLFLCSAQNRRALVVQNQNVNCILDKNLTAQCEVSTLSQQKLASGTS